MSGTSLDGLDLALCEFKENDSKTDFKILCSQTISYEAVWKERLVSAFDATAEQYFKLHSLYGEFIGNQITVFLTQHQQTADFIASHGHTVFHRPALGFTTQIGCGATIAATTGIKTICDFRSMDVAHKGQGAPLVPIGDRDLFSNFQSCLNIGGIANISFQQNGQTKAYDICIANMALNYVTELIGKAYDNGGTLAKEGNISTVLLEQLHQLNSNQQSLGREWFEKLFLPVLEKHSISVNDKLATLVHYIAKQISDCLTTHHLQSVLISGGGAYNTFLIDTLKKMYHGKVEIPNDEIIQFKEALIFAYLGYLRINEKPNALSSVTGAKKDSIGGCVYL